jgi:hypothetical protein
MFFYDCQNKRDYFPNIFSDYSRNREEVFFCEKGLVLLKLCFKGFKLKLGGSPGVELSTTRPQLIGTSPDFPHTLSQMYIQILLKANGPSFAVRESHTQFTYLARSLRVGDATYVDSVP